MLPPSLTIRPTEHFFMLGEVMVRAWTSDEGSIVLVAAVASPPEEPGVSPLAVLGGLIEIPAPDAEAQRRWAAKIMEGNESGGGPNEAD